MKAIKDILLEMNNNEKDDIDKIKEDIVKNKEENETQKLQPSLIIKQKFNNMFVAMRDGRGLDETRAGLHASAIVASDSNFCYRQQVLSLLYEMSQGSDLPVSVLKIFSAGSYIHAKWQDMFKACDKAIEGFEYVRNEARSYSEKWNLYFTPDAIIKIDGVTYIVEIKSMNTFSYKHAAVSTNPHPHARHQIQLYMHLTGIHHGLILIEDKNTQEFEVFKVDYNYKEVLPYLDRLLEIKSMLKDLIEDDIEPQRICNKETCKRASECNMRDACFGRGIKLLNGVLK